MIKFLIVDIFVMENGEPVKKNTQVLLKDKKVVIFGLPGAYTSVCSCKTSSWICEYV